MLQPPKSRKFKKFKKRPSSLQNRPNQCGKSFNSTHFALKYGDFGLISVNNGRMSAVQLEATRRTITFALKRNGKLWIRAFPDIPVTKKPTDTRMGKGKGNVDHWVACLRGGQIIIELLGVTDTIAKTALLKGAQKLPFDTKVVQRFTSKTTNLN